MRPLRGSVNPFWDRFKKTRTTRLYKGYRIDGDGTGTSFEIRAQGVKFGSMRDAQRWADAEVREEAKAAKYEAQRVAKDKRDEAQAVKRLAREAREAVRGGDSGSGESRKHSARVSSRYKGYRLTGGRDGWEVPELDKGSLFDSKADAKKFVDAQVRSNPMARRKSRRNPRTWKTISARDVGKYFEGFGTVLPRDVGKKYYTERDGGGVQYYVENDSQMRKRLGTQTNPGGLVPAKLKRMPNGMIKVYVAPGAAAKLRANPMRQWDIRIPPTVHIGSIRLGPVRKTKAEARRAALEEFNSHRRHEGLPSVKSLPKGTTIREYQS